MEYERTWKPLDRLPEPRMVDADVRADLEPERAAFGVSATFTYVNNHVVPVDSILVSLGKRELTVDTIAWSRPATLLVNDSPHGVRRHRLETPLAVNDTVRLRYRAHYESRERSLSPGPTPRSPDPDPERDRGEWLVRQLRVLPVPRLPVRGSWLRKTIAVRRGCR